jgi:hypothetical protein
MGGSKDGPTQQSIDRLAQGFAYDRSIIIGEGNGNKSSLLVVSHGGSI